MLLFRTAVEMKKIAHLWTPYGSTCHCRRHTVNIYETTVTCFKSFFFQFTRFCFRFNCRFTAQPIQFLNGIYTIIQNLS